MAYFGFFIALIGLIFTQFDSFYVGLILLAIGYGMVAISIFNAMFDME